MASMWRAGILLLLTVSAAAQDVEELKRLAPAFDTAKGEGPESFRVEARMKFGVVRVVYRRDRGAAMILWNRVDGCPLIVANDERALLYDASTGTALYNEGNKIRFELYQRSDELTVSWSMETGADGKTGIRVDLRSVVPEAESLDVRELENGRLRLSGRSRRQGLFTAWIERSKSPAYRRAVLVPHGSRREEWDGNRFELTFASEVQAEDFPRIPDFEKLAGEFPVVRAMKDNVLQISNAALIVPIGLARPSERKAVESALHASVAWGELEKPYARASTAMVAHFGRGPLVGHYEEACEAYRAGRLGDARRGFEQALEDGDTRALADFGAFVLRVDDDVERARNLFRRGAEEGYPAAQFSLGWLLANNPAFRDLEQSIVWFRSAAKSGHPKAAANLGRAYDCGLGVPVDVKAAARWYRVAAEGGNAAAQFYVGCARFGGLGLEQDDARASRWFERAAEQGLAEAQFMLGMCFATGRGVAKDMAQAVSWWTQAAKQGNAMAQCCLGMAYRDGKGVEADPAEAVKWLGRSVKRGQKRACAPLAKMYEEGAGVSRNPVRAHALYTVGGEEDEAARLAKELTPEQLEESKRVQRLYRPDD
jgi:TPR repeat protein